MSRGEKILEAAGGGVTLQARFLWHQDRLAHTITVKPTGRAIPLLASREGAGDAPWPPSPPLQDSSREAPAGEQAMLLVGMAGRAHWSLAVTAEPGRAALVFDAACRANQRPDFLGSEYRTMVAPGEVVDGRSAQFDLPSARVRLELVDLGDEATARVTTTLSGLVIVVAEASDGWPQTIRWKYRIEAERVSPSPSGKGR